MAGSASGKGGSDPIQRAIAALESRVDEIGTAVFGTDMFARGANVATAMTTQMRKGMSDHMARQLSFYNMPSREDVAAIGERLMAMDERMVRIEAMLEELMPKSGPAAASPPRTKKPPAKAAASEATSNPPAKRAPAKPTAKKPAARRKTKS